MGSSPGKETPWQALLCFLPLEFISLANERQGHWLEKGLWAVPSWLQNTQSQYLDSGARALGLGSEWNVASQGWEACVFPANLLQRALSEENQEQAQL